MPKEKESSTRAIFAGILAGEDLERETGFEPATSTLARSHSTAELLPLSPFILQQFRFCAKFTAPAMHSRNVRRERFQAPRCTAPVHRVRLSAHGHNVTSRLFLPGRELFLSN